MALHASADSVKCTKLAAHVSDICGESKNIPGSRLCDIARQAQRAHCEVKDSAKGVLQGEKGGDELGEGLNKGTKSSIERWKDAKPIHKKAYEKVFRKPMSKAAKVVKKAGRKGQQL